MKTLIERACFLFLFSMIAIVLAKPVAWSQDRSKGEISGHFDGQAPLSWSISESDIDERKAFSEKIDSAFYDIVQSAKKTGTVSLNEANQMSLKISGDRVQVEVIVRPENLEEAKTAVEEAGGEVTGVSFDEKFFQGWIPVSELEFLAEDPNIFLYANPLKPSQAEATIAHTWRHL